MEQSNGETVELWNGWGVERLKRLNLMIVETVERWNVWTVERLRGETVKGVEPV